MSFTAGPVQAQLLLNHFKFGIAGPSEGRIKTYYELLTRMDWPTAPAQAPRFDSVGRSRLTDKKVFTSKRLGELIAAITELDTLE